MPDDRLLAWLIAEYDPDDSDRIREEWLAEHFVDVAGRYPEVARTGVVTEAVLDAEYARLVAEIAQARRSNR